MHQDIVMLQYNNYIFLPSATFKAHKGTEQKPRFITYSICQVERQKSQLN